MISIPLGLATATLPPSIALPSSVVPTVATAAHYTLNITQDVTSALAFLDQQNHHRMYRLRPGHCGYNEHIMAVRPPQEDGPSSPPRYVYTFMRENNAGMYYCRYLQDLETNYDSRYPGSIYIHNPTNQDFFSGGAPAHIVGQKHSTTPEICCSNNRARTMLVQWLMQFAKAGFWFIVDTEATMVFDTFDDTPTAYRNTTLSWNKCPHIQVATPTTHPR